MYFLTLLYCTFVSTRYNYVYVKFRLYVRAARLFKYAYRFVCMYSQDLQRQKSCTNTK
jgi:hypothetical protein